MKQSKQSKRHPHPKHQIPVSVCISDSSHYGSSCSSCQRVLPQVTSFPSSDQTKIKEGKQKADCQCQSSGKSDHCRFRHTAPWPIDHVKNQAEHTVPGYPCRCHHHFRRHPVFPVQPYDHFPAFLSACNSLPHRQ